MVRPAQCSSWPVGADLFISCRTSSSDHVSLARRVFGTSALMPSVREKRSTSAASPRGPIPGLMRLAQPFFRALSSTGKQKPTISMGGVVFANMTGESDATKKATTASGPRQQPSTHTSLASATPPLTTAMSKMRRCPVSPDGHRGSPPPRGRHHRAHVTRRFVGITGEQGQGHRVLRSGFDPSVLTTLSVVTRRWFFSHHRRSSARRVPVGSAREPAPDAGCCDRRRRGQSDHWRRARTRPA